MNKSKLSRLSAQYLAALKEHSEQEANAVLSVAYELGISAVALGLETLDLARIHEQSLAALILPGFAKAEREIKIERAILFSTKPSSRLKRSIGSHWIPARS